VDEGTYQEAFECLSDCTLLEPKTGFLLLELALEPKTLEVPQSFGRDAET